ncbi:anti-sigma factor [Parapedobacter sp.]
MNIQEYISSGIIENHVLGLTSPAEDAEVVKLSEQYPEVRQAVRDAEEALMNYALLHGKTPPSNTKDKIFEALAEEGLVGGMSGMDAQSGSSVGTGPARSHRITRILAVAASLLWVASVAFHLFKMADFKQQIRQLEQERTDLIAQNETFMAQIQEAHQELKVLGNPSFKTVVLSGVPGHDDNRALVYWHTTSHEVYLKPDNLPTLPADKQYQLWGIIAGKPVSAGTYALPGTNETLQQMVSLKDVEMFAITIEPTGGSEQPTLDQMVVAGEPL